jgi:putative phosphoribosyl transferase
LIATDWLAAKRDFQHVGLGYFGASTGAAAALRAAAERNDIAAVVSRGGRPDLAEESLPHVRAATLLIVGGLDHQVIELNRFAFAKLHRAAIKELTIVSGAGHLFEEPGALQKVARLSGQWFLRHLIPGKIEEPGRSYDGTGQASAVR